MAVRNGFIRKKVRSFTLGEKIRKLRSERRLSLAEISKNTGIRTQYLEALEDGKYDKLPALVYVHGFLRAYAKYLGENPKKFITLFERERGIANHINKDDRQESERLWASPRPLVAQAFTPRIFLSVGMVVVMFFAIFYVYSGFSRFVSDPQIFVASPEDGVMLYESTVEVRGKTDSGATLFVNDQEMLVDEMGNFSENIEIREGVNTLILRSVNAFGRETVEERRVIGARSEEEKEEYEETQRGVVRIEGEGESVEIDVRLDENEEETRVLSEGEEYEFFYESSFEVRSQAGSRTYVILEDREATPLSQEVGEASVRFGIAGEQELIEEIISNEE